MQPLTKAAGDAAAADAEPGTSAFAALAAADVKPNAVFFHKFYSAKEARAPARKRAAAEGDEDASDASDAEIGRCCGGVLSLLLGWICWMCPCHLSCSVLEGVMAGCWKSAGFHC